MDELEKMKNIVKNTFVKDALKSLEEVIYFMNSAEDIKYSKDLIKIYNNIKNDYKES